MFKTWALADCRNELFYEKDYIMYNNYIAQLGFKNKQYLLIHNEEN